MSETTLERTRNSYSREDVERGLAELALANGSTRRAERRLKQRGIHIPESTLRVWVENHAGLYEEIQAEVLPRVREVIAEESEDLALTYAEAERELVTDLLKDKDKLEAKDLAGAIRNLATSRGISVDKASLLRGQPTAIVQRADAAELLRELGQVVDAEVVESVSEPEPVSLSAHGHATNAGAST